jgi:hypothetical protein
MGLVQALPRLVGLSLAGKKAQKKAKKAGSGHEKGIKAGFGLRRLRLFKYAASCRQLTHLQISPQAPITHHLSLITNH